MGQERKFDIEEFVKKTKSFHADKDRAEKLQKKEGYLNSLCPKIEDKVCFQAVYEELFPDDKKTIELLKKLITESFNQEKDEWLFYNVETIEEFEQFSAIFKKRVKVILKQLQRQQLLQIQMMQRKMNEKNAEKQEIKNQEQERELTTQVNVSKENVGLTKTGKSHQGEFLKSPFILGGAIDMAKGKKILRTGKTIGKTFEELSYELRSELEKDRVHASQRQEMLPEMIKESQRQLREEMQQINKRHQRQREMPKQLGR